MSVIRVKVFLTLAIVLLQDVQVSQGGGYCNSLTSNCGATCTTNDDCEGDNGGCWAGEDNCGTTGYCNSQSGNCGTGCSTSNDCQGGACWASEDNCGTTGYCNSQSGNCGTGCSTSNDCQGGACWASEDNCPTPSYGGTCNAASSNCGTPCDIQSDCPGGDCSHESQTCTPSPPSYCNAASSNCGSTCDIDTDCPGGYCQLSMDDCGTPTPTTGYCNAASTNCGTGCNNAEDCPEGDCNIEQESCGVPTPIGDVIGTYLGALPDGVAAPSLSQVPADLNFILLGFAKDLNYNGKFVPFSEWTRLGITKATITQDKATNPNRKYMVSLGGAAAYGGTFSIAAGISVNQWLDDAFASIKSMVDDLNADGVDIQFEGGTKNANFPAAVNGLLQRFKTAGYITSVGPYYGGTWDDYVSLNLGNADYVFCQFYAKNLQTVTSVENDLKGAANDLGGWRKLVAGFNSYNRNPNPSIVLQVVENLKDDLKGTFTWAAEHSATNNPPYCIEKNSKKILVDNQSPGSCFW